MNDRLSGTGSSTFSSPSTSSPSSTASSRYPDGYHRRPSGNCERVIDTRGTCLVVLMVITEALTAAVNV
ncbi:MAG: hypothetical protein M3311_00580 [Thermoproteota archaeon]|nr:hypothetical protein [Thermoproteota archaeon]